MMRPREQDAVHGRGASWNPANRFDGVEYVCDADTQDDPEETARPETAYLEDTSKSILSYNESPDVGFTVSINPYRGCEHGCIYCYARPTHEYLGFSAGLDFETRILVKHRAPELLRNALMKRDWQPQTIAISGVTDPYQPAERRFRVTRGILEVLAEFRNPVGLVTKNKLITRDVDLLADLARDNAAMAYVSITTLDLGLNRVLEPRSSSPAQRLDAIRVLAEAGVPTGVMVAPVVPAITDHEMPAILDAAARAGARHAGYIMLRLPFAVAPLFERWLEQHFPDRKEKVLNRVRSLRGGKLYNAEFGERMKGEGVFADQIKSVFQIACRRAGINQSDVTLYTAAFRRPGAEQLPLF